MKYYLIAGEPSGDLHGANLIRGLKKADPAAEFRFWGGDGMAAAGGAEHLYKHYRETSFFGFVQVLKNLRTIRRQFRECRADITAFAPDVLILIDYPGFNLKMARWAHEQGIRTFYYIAPKVWAWRESRVKDIRRYVDQLFVIFPFERGYFADYRITPIFEGNPLVDAVAMRRETLPSAAEFRRRHELDKRPIIALLAGSRRGEIRDNLPLMVELSKCFPDYQFVVTAVSWLDRELYERYLAGSDIRYVVDETYETLSVSEAAVVTSGTATLETALMGIPEVVVYRTLWIQVKLRPFVLNVPFISLVNLNLGRPIVSEIVQSDLSVDEAAEELRAILVGGGKREWMLDAFGDLDLILGEPGASDRFARRMVELLSEDIGEDESETDPFGWYGEDSDDPDESDELDDPEDLDAEDSDSDAYPFGWHCRNSDAPEDSDVPEDAAAPDSEDSAPEAGAFGPDESEKEISGWRCGNSDAPEDSDVPEEAAAPDSEDVVPEEDVAPETEDSAPEAEAFGPDESDKEVSGLKNGSDR